MCLMSVCAARSPSALVALYSMRVAVPLSCACCVVITIRLLLNLFCSYLVRRLICTNGLRGGGAAKWRVSARRKGDVLLSFCNTTKKYIGISTHDYLRQLVFVHSFIVYSRKVKKG